MTVPTRRDLITRAYMAGLEGGVLTISGDDPVLEMARAFDLGQSYRRGEIPRQQHVAGGTCWCHRCRLEAIAGEGPGADREVLSRLREARETSGLSQAGLAKYFRVATNTVARWERGEMAPTGSKLGAVASWIRVYL